MAGEVLIPPTPGCKGFIAVFFSTSTMRGEQGMQVETVQECEKSGGLVDRRAKVQDEHVVEKD